MKKLISLLLTVLMLCSVMAGCVSSDNPGTTGSPAESTGAPENTTSAPENTTAATENTTAATDATEAAGGEKIKITDSFSISDPEGIPYETRHIYSGDKNCTMIQGMVMQGYNASAVYVILYEKEGKAVAEYQVIVCDSEEDATKLKGFYATTGMNLTQEGSVLHMFSDTDMIQSNIAMIAGLGAISEETVEAYLNYLTTMNGLTKQ